MLETKLCSKCNQELSIENFRLKSGASAKMYHSNICRSCEKEYEREYKAKKREKKAVLREDVEIRFKREYKQIEPQRILDMSKSTIPLIGTDEIFVKLMDYKNAYLSNYGRCIRIADNGKYYLLKGNGQGINFNYSLPKSVFIDGEWVVERSNHMFVAQAVIDNFIVNHDKANNTYIWHAGYDQDDNYYRNLYPLSKYQYYAVRRYYNLNGIDTEDVILNIMNDFQYMPDNYCEKLYKPMVSGVGYWGCDDVDTTSRSYIKWKNMLERCYLPSGAYYGKSTVSKEWHSYSNFKLWYDKHAYALKNCRMDIDHNILLKGNTEYSSTACAIIPHAVNTLITYDKSNNNGLPPGVSYDRENQRYRAECTDNGKQVKLGSYKTIAEASAAYKEYKERYLKDVAGKFQKYIPYNVYEALMNWEI